jgi:hypothetical protein
LIHANQPQARLGSVMVQHINNSLVVTQRLIATIGHTKQSFSGAFATTTPSMKLLLPTSAMGKYSGAAEVAIAMSTTSAAIRVWRAGPHNLVLNER